MRKVFAILLCIALFILPATITVNAETDSGRRSVAGDEPYLVDVGVGHYAYSTYSVSVPVYITTNNQNQICADMSNFDSDYALSCYVTNSESNSRITLYASNYETTGNAITVQISTSDGNIMDSKTKLLHKFHSTMGSENPTEICYFELGAPAALDGKSIAAGNYTGTLSLRFICEVA